MPDLKRAVAIVRYGLKRAGAVQLLAMNCSCAGPSRMLSVMPCNTPLKEQRLRSNWIASINRESRIQTRGFQIRNTRTKAPGPLGQAPSHTLNSTLRSSLFATTGQEFRKMLLAKSFVLFTGWMKRGIVKQEALDLVWRLPTA